MRTARAALALYLVAPLVLVLGPLPRGGLDLWHDLLLRAAAVPGFPLLTRPQAEALANVLLFVPLGLLLPLALPRVRLRVVAGGLILLSGALEVAQLTLADRTSSPRDVLTNGCGALAGVALAAAVRWSRRGPQPPR